VCIFQSSAQSAYHLYPTAERERTISAYSKDVLMSDCTNHQTDDADRQYHDLMDVICSLLKPGFGLHEEARTVQLREVDLNFSESNNLDCGTVELDVLKPLHKNSGTPELNTDASKSKSEVEAPDVDVLWKDGDIEVRLESSECSEDDDVDINGPDATTVVAQSEVHGEKISIKISNKALLANNIEKRNLVKTAATGDGVTREKRFYKTSKARVSHQTKVNSRKVAASTYDFDDEVEPLNEIRGEKKRETVLSSVQNENTPSHAKVVAGTRKANALRGVNVKVGRGRPRGVRRPKEATSSEVAGSADASEGTTSGSVPWSSVGEFAKQKYVKKEPESERIKDEGSNVKISCQFEPLSVNTKSSRNKEIWMPYQEGRDRKAPKKLILKRRRSDDVDSEPVSSRRKFSVVDDAESQSSSGPLVNGKRRSRSAASLATDDTGKTSSRRKRIDSKKILVKAKNGLRQVEIAGEQVSSGELPNIVDQTPEVQAPVPGESEDSLSLQTRQTNEEVFRQISREAGNGLACRHCKRELRTRAQLMSHAKGGCNGKASPTRSDGESNDSAPASIRQRRVSELVSVSVMRPERNRRHTIEIQNADSVVVEPKPVSDGKLTADERPEVKLDVKPDVNVLNGMQLKSCVIEISPLKKPVDEKTPDEDAAKDKEPVEDDESAVKETESAVQDKEPTKHDTELTIKDEESVKDEEPMSEGPTSEKEPVLSGDLISDKEPVKDVEPVKNTEPVKVDEPAIPPVKHEEPVKNEEPVKEKERKPSDVIIPSNITSLSELSESTVQCVCDGCGEVVPDCSWLTAHIVTCPGRSGNTDEIVAEEAEPEPETPAWKQELPEPDRSIEHPVAEEPSTQAPAEVDAAGLLQLLRSVENSLLYGSSTNGAAGVPDDVIDTHDIITGTEPKSSGVVQVPEDVKDKDAGAIGRIVSYNGVEMYEFSEYKCSGCPLTFGEKAAAERHANFSVDHGGSSVQRQPIYVCMQCDMRCRQQRLVWFHVTYICHKSIVDETAEAATNQPAEDLYRCTMCTKLFFAADYLRRHVHLNHPSAVEISVAETAGSSVAANGSHFGLAAQLLSDWNDYCPPSDGVDGKQNAASANSHQQALLDLACSMVLDGICPVTSTEKDTTPTAAASSAPPAPAGVASLPVRRTAKGIVYKNVFMQCIVSYICSNCGRDLSAKSAKRDHRALAPPSCFDAGPGGRRLFTYVRHYTYLCPYCGDRAATQKACRAHQLTVCLPRMGVKTDELNHKQLLCPFCQRKYFNIITLKGHMTLVHQVSRAESAALIANVTGGIIGEELLGLLPEGSILQGLSGHASSDGKQSPKGLLSKGVVKRQLKTANDVGAGVVVAAEKKSRENEDDGFAEDVDSYASGSVSQDSHFETVDPSVSLFASKMPDEPTADESPVLPEVVRPVSADKHEPVSSSHGDHGATAQTRGVFRRRTSSSWQRSKRKFMAKPHKKARRRT
jgi:hypothetical protein